MTAAGRARRQAVARPADARIDWVHAEAVGRWYGIMQDGSVYVVRRAAADGHLLVSRARVARIPSREWQVLSWDAAMRWLQDDHYQSGKDGHLETVDERA